MATTIDLNVDLNIHAFSGSGISDYESGYTNCVVINDNGRPIVTQRPSIDISEDSSGIAGLNDRARGIYYWETNSKLYIVHDNDVYEDTQDSARIAENSGTFSTGTERCTMLETIGVPRLVILDAENNKGWVMTAAKVLDQIASNFPSTLAHGGAILDSYLIVMDEDGVIYNSDPDDPTTFGATAFLEAERENDKGVYLGKHHDEVVALGTRTIEFFYNASNATGSILNRRQGLSYNVGCVDGLGVWENGDTIYFLGSNPSGQIAVYRLQNSQLSIVSNESLNSYLTQGITQEGVRVVMNGIAAMGHDTLLITVYTLTGASPGTITPELTISLDTATGKAGFWETAANSNTTFPLMAFTKRTGGQSASASARAGEGIFHNGDIININDKLIPVDTVLGSDGVYLDTYESNVYVNTSSDSGTNIELKIRTGLIDGGTKRYKFQSTEGILAEPTANSQTLTIRHSNGSSNNFNAGRTIDTSKDRKEIHQGGRFTKRNVQIEYSGNEQLYLEEYYMELEVGF